MAIETKSDLVQRIHLLEERLAEAEETLRALRSGEVDAVLVDGPDGEQIYTLKGADEAYRIMVENMAEGAITLGQDGLILFSNEQFASLIEVPLERVIGSSVRDFVASEDSFVLSVLLATHRRAEAQLRLQKGPAALVSVQISANTLLLDGVERICFIIRDLTEQERNEGIVAAERLARSILDQAAGAILVVDPMGKIIRASRATDQLAKEPVLLRQFDEVFSLRISSDALTDGVAMDYAFGEILATVRRLGTVSDLEATLRLRDGQKFEVMVSAGLLTGADSECLGCIVLISDVSRLRRAELEIRRLHTDLERGAHLRPGALESANKELETFAKSIAQNLHSPLQAISGGSLALLERQGAKLDVEAHGLLHRVLDGAEQMRRLIDGLLQLSRIGQTDVATRTVDLSALAQTISEQLRQLHPDRHVEFVIQPGLVAVGDPALMEIALTNLLDNAVKCTQSEPQARIEFGRTEAGGESVFFVRDNGVGFDSKDAGMLFQAFQRLPAASEFPGAGIGLAAVKRVIERHAGRVWAEGKVGEGATFYFRLGTSE